MWANKNTAGPKCAVLVHLVITVLINAGLLVKVTDKYLSQAKTFITLRDQNSGHNYHGRRYLILNREQSLVG